MSRFGFNRIKFVLPINLQANDHDSREEERERERESFMNISGSNNLQT